MRRILRHPPRPRPRGMVTAVVVMFLIATVLFVLSQTISVSGNNVQDGQRQSEANAAFFLAESALDYAQSVAAGAVNAGSYTNTSCSTIAMPSASLGAGTVSVSGVSTPSSCSLGSATPCTSCELTATGSVGLATTTLKQEIALQTTNGVTCNGATTGDCDNRPTVTWQLKLKNTAAVPGMGVFNLTYIRQGNNTPSCAASSNCVLQHNLSSPSNGVNSTGLMGNAVVIPASTTYPIYQTTTQPTRNVAEVGVFFLGTVTAVPTLTGPTSNPGAASFWDDNKNSATNTVGPSGTATGATSDGTATAGGTCDAPSASRQSCTSWCYGGDTLIHTFAGNVTALSDQLSGVTFGTNSGVGQNIAMTRVTKYPTALDTGAPANIAAEIWYARNPNLVGSSPLATNASSWKGRGTGAVGARWQSNNSDTTSIAVNASAVTVLTVGNSFTGYPASVISVGDSVSNSGGGGSPSCTTSCGTIAAQLTSAEPGGALGGRGTYQLSGGAQTVGAANNRQWTISSNVLRVSACTTCFFASGDPLSGLISGALGAQASLGNYGATEATGGIGRYSFGGAATYLPSGANLYAGTPGATLYVPTTVGGSANSQPAVTSPTMLLAVKSGTGTLAPGTKVDSLATGNAATGAFTLSSSPTAFLDNATICAGTCAFFVPSGNTSFALGGITANFNEWASAFMCVKGVTQTPQVVTNTAVAKRRWHEVVQ